MKVLDIYNERLNKFNNILGDYIKNCFKCLQFNNENNCALIFSDMEAYTGDNKVPHFIEDNDDKYFQLSFDVNILGDCSTKLNIRVTNDNIFISFSNLFNFNLSGKNIGDVPNVLEIVASDIRLINSDNFHSKLNDFFNTINFN